MKNLKGKKILITAGPTWVAIDSIRVITNIASGQTGALLAQKAKRQGAKVTLVLGPVNTCCLDNAGIRVVNFKFFDELERILTGELRSKKYHALIHSAAVADYRPIKKYPGKVRSNKKKLHLHLVPTPKLVDQIKKVSPHLVTVAFKFEPGLKGEKLIKATSLLFRHSRVDMAVANTNAHHRYQAYIVKPPKTIGPLSSKEKMAEALLKALGEILGRDTV